MTAWDVNTHGQWCTCCGMRVASPDAPAPEECSQCGFPDAGKVADYYFGDDDEPEDEEPDPGAECGRWINGRLGKYCSLAGTEFCDFECPHR